MGFLSGCVQIFVILFTLRSYISSSWSTSSTSIDGCMFPRSTLNGLSASSVTRGTECSSPRAH